MEDPFKQWPYERGETCPPEKFEEVRDRMLGMLLSLTAAMIADEVVPPDALNFLCENALAFRTGMPALVHQLGFDEAKRLVERFCVSQGITHIEKVAPADALSDAEAWHQIYVGRAVHDGVGLLSIKRGTISHTFIDQLDRAYERLAADDAVKAIVIAPDGTYSREFGHGADLGAFVPVLGKHDEALALIQRWKRTLGKLRAGKPTVAALVGRVLGGGLELAAACHARIAGKGTRLAFPETTVGVIPGLGGCHMVHRSVDATYWPRINEMLLTGEIVGADEAQTWGLVTSVVPIPELPAASMTLAAALADGSASMPEFREGPGKVDVSTEVATTNAAGVPLDAELRELLVSTIKDANAVGVAEGGAIEEQRAAQSLAMSSSAIGVKAMMRGKPPVFEHPLG